MGKWSVSGTVRTYIICIRAQLIVSLNNHNSNIMIRRRQWHPTPVLLPGKYHGQRSLVGCSPWGRKESDTTERLHFLSLSVSVDGRLGCFHVLAIVTSATVNTGFVCIFELWFSLDICPGVGLLGHVLVLCLVFLTTSILSS